MSKFKNAKHLKEGDRVVAIAGNEKGKTGVVMARFGDKVLVQGLNMRKKHIRKSQEAPQGGVVEREMPVHTSNVLICDEAGKPMKLHVRENENGERQLFYTDSKSGEEVLYRNIKRTSR